MITVEMEEKMSLSYLHGSNLCPIIQECETKGRRKRKKARAEAANGEAKKRRLSDEQVKFLEMNFGKEQKLESGRKVHLATELSLDPKQVAVWFQNRRARWKNKQLEEEYMKLKTVNKNIVIEKCHLENEVLKLKERLNEAQKEIKKLSGSLKEVSAVAEASDSPSPPLSTATKQPPFKGIGWKVDSAPFKEFGWEGDTDIMYVNEYKNYMEWFDFYYGI